MELLVLNTDFESVAVIDTYESMIWTDRYNSYGDFEIFFAMDTQLLQYLKEDYYLWLKDSEHCMIIEDIKINADTEEGNHLIVTGRSLESILERRIIWGQRIFNGNLQNGIQTMLNECIISPSIADRKISNFVFLPSTDPKITSLKIDNQYTGDCLYDVVKGLCEENNIGFKIVLTDENKFAFSLYAGVDRSYEQTENPYVVFSPNFENIINSNYYSSRASFRNVTLVAGEGEGASRRTVIVGSASGLDRRELFTDARDISSDTEDGTLSDAEYMAQLQTKGLKNLAGHIVTTAFEGEVEVTRLFKYGEDFFIYRDVSGRLKMCVWDFNNACDNYQEQTTMQVQHFDVHRKLWFNMMVKDEYFTERVIRRYRELRESWLNEKYLLRYIDEVEEYLGPAIERNFERWEDSLRDDTLLAPAERNVHSHQEAVRQLKDFIRQRGRWMDENIESLRQYSAESRVKKYSEVTD